MSSFVCMAVDCLLLLVAWRMYKKEGPLGAYAFLIVVIAGFCIMVKTQAHNLDMYILEKSISNDYNYLAGSVGYMNDIFEEWDYDKADVSSKKTYDALCKGVMITNWEEPENKLQQLMANQLHIGSFEQLRYHFYTVKGQAEVYLVIKDGRATMRLVNPTPLVTETWMGEKGYFEVCLDKEVK